MKKIFYLGCLVTGIPLWIGCAGNASRFPGDPPDPSSAMHAWVPPSEERLEARRQRQRVLDRLTAQVGQARQNQNWLDEHVAPLADVARLVQARPEVLESKLTEEVASEEKRQEKLEREVDLLRATSRLYEQKLRKIALRPVRRRPPPKVEDIWARAVRYFRDGEYHRSLKTFASALKNNPPGSLKDDLVFGLAASHFRLGHYDRAAELLNEVIAGYPQGNKWLVSQVLLGYTHYLNGERSRALFVLTRVREHQPPQALGQIIDDLIRKARGEDLHGTS